jgi:hypothetical protein
MRYSNLAAAVLLGMGMFTPPAGAQEAQTPADAAMQQTLSRRARAALETALAQGQFAKGFQFKGDVDHLRQPTDCGMPVITGDPSIDALFSKRPQPSPPGHNVRWTMKMIPVQPCPNVPR